MKLGGKKPPKRLKRTMPGTKQKIWHCVFRSHFRSILPWSPQTVKRLPFFGVAYSAANRQMLFPFFPPLELFGEHKARESPWRNNKDEKQNENKKRKKRAYQSLFFQHNKQCRHLDLYQRQKDLWERLCQTDVIVLGRLPPRPNNPKVRLV